MMGLVATTLAAKPMASPNKKLTLQVKGQGLALNYQGMTVLELPTVGMGELPTALPQPQRKGKVVANYRMQSGKRSHCTNVANEYAFQLDERTLLTVRLYNDGLAYRYELTGLDGVTPPVEHSAYRIAEGTRRWMLQWCDSYEGFYPLSTTAKVKAVPSYGPLSVSPDGFNNRWGFPALLQPMEEKDVFVLLSEANIERQQSAACLRNEGEVFRVAPDRNESQLTGAWHTPWRIAIVGTLADVVESTLVTDVSEPSKLTDTAWIQPGVVSWVYWAYNHGSNDYDIIKRYTDLAVALHLPYVLIDAEWDTMKDGKSIEDAVRYANEQGVKPMIWYNSSVGWVNGAPTPMYRLNKAEDREREFAWCERIGVAGVKIDFFSGDDLRNMDFCQELLESAARHHLLVNFHGATIPRGWQRTYPNLLSTEAVYGAEWYNNVGTFTTKAAAHNATLPFTRNIVGPMDYTPCAFSDSQHPHITTHAHELALTVLFESGLQHLADRPESLLAQPDEVKRFFGALPAAWDDTQLVSGYPGDHVVIARRSGKTWYVAGINGTDETKDIVLSLPFIKGKTGLLFADGQPWNIRALDALPHTIHCQPRGGFVIVVE